MILILLVKNHYDINKYEYHINLVKNIIFSVTLPSHIPVCS